MKIAVIGASGWLGGAIAREAVSRGHEVTAIGRDGARLSQVEGARAVVADLDDPESVVDAVRGSDVVVSSVTDRSTPDRSRPRSSMSWRRTASPGSGSRPAPDLRRRTTPGAAA